MTSNYEDLKATLEKIRAEKYPDVPKDVVEEILTAQILNAGNRVAAKTTTRDIVLQYAKQITAEGE